MATDSDKETIEISLPALKLGSVYPPRANVASHPGAEPIEKQFHRRRKFLRGRPGEVVMVGPGSALIHTASSENQG
ncbi:MAG: hypothetical protein JNK90_09585 [Planctomycetaceae bacterium]|nr:hypothetical protein [Planctomycetaceae bacterium]